jgi:hypothetical protein
MRAVFTVEIPAIGHGKFPENSEIIEQLHTHGWEVVSLATIEDPVTRQEKYKEYAKELLEQMPEIRKTEEAEHIIYYGVLQEDKTKFVVTRVIQGRMTFRLLNPNLASLERSTENMIKILLSSGTGDSKFKISNSSVLVYEREFEDVIIKGTVIANPFRKAIKENRRDYLLVLIAMLILVPVIIGAVIYSSEEHRLIGGSLERLSTALITTIIVSALGLFQNYYEYKRETPISWEPYSDQRN